MLFFSLEESCGGVWSIHLLRVRAGWVPAAVALGRTHPVSVAVPALSPAQQRGLLLTLLFLPAGPGCKNKWETAGAIQMKNNILHLHITFCNRRFRLCFLKFKKCCHYPHDKSGSWDNFLSLSRIFNFLGNSFGSP